MSKKKWIDLNPGCINSEAGNSIKNFAPPIRSGKKPLFNIEPCINCFFCWLFCPKNAIIIENKKVTGIKYDYCDGCGICVNECPVKEGPSPLNMIKEEIEL